MIALLPTLAACAAMGAGPWVFWKGFRAYRVKQVIESTPTARIRSLAMGLVELQGAVGSRSRVTAPFSGRPCAYWEVEVQTLSSQSRSGGRSWQTVHRESSGHPFYLRDETGVALVYPQGADCRIQAAIEEETHGLGVPEPYASWLADRALPMRHLWVMGPMRFRERSLEDGRAVFVLGRAFPPPRSVAINMDEEALQATGTEAIGASHVRTSDEKLNAVVRRGASDPAFLISERSEKSMTMEYGLKAFAGALGGPAITLFGLWMLMQLMRRAG